MDEFSIILQAKLTDADCMEITHLLNEAYHRGRADAEAEHNAMCETCVHKVSKADIEQIRADAIDDVKSLIKTRLVDNLSIENATKYGNKNAKQQANSYATVMKYEIADCIDDLLDDLEQLKEQKND